MNPQNRLTTSTFVEKARLKHGDKYDYSKVVYIDNQTKVCIICPIHGEFWQSPNSHLSGRECRKCGYLKRKPKKCTSQDDFISSLKKIHGDKYDYSSTIYKGGRNQISFVCPVHGNVTMNAKNHLDGHGCPKCGVESRANKARLSTEEFINKAIIIHGDKYDYSKVDYKSTSKNVCIICPEHGEFLQTPNNHLNGAECPVCGYLKTKSSVHQVGKNDMYFEAKTECYRKWKSILKRTSTYCGQLAYKDVSVCEEWLTFSNFKSWYEKFYVKGFAIDKDLLSPPTNKVYSPNTCCFLPRIINNAIKTNSRNGMTCIKPLKNGEYIVTLNSYSIQTKIGCFDNIQDAKIAYKSAKEKYVKELAEKYYNEGKITERVYNALLKYEVDIMD